VPVGLCCDLAIQENRFASTDGSPDLAAKGRTDVGARLVTLVEVRLRQRERRRRVDQHEVRLVANGQRPSSRNPKTPRRFPCYQFGDSRQ
jgi:hypothetical protein